jgi:hypothetical protein
MARSKHGHLSPHAAGESMSAFAANERGSLPHESTPASVWQAGCGRPIGDELLEWPPDLFALTSLILDRSEAYRFGLAPFGAEQWQARRLQGWPEAVETAARQWSSGVEDGKRAAPDFLAGAWRVLRDRADMPLERIADGRDQQTSDALLTLHAVADEACVGLGVALAAADATGSLYRARCRELLARTGSLARIPSTFLRVLPKERTPPSGTSSRSLSRYVCALGPGVHIQWVKLPCRRMGSGASADHINFLLLPWPLRVRETDFRPLDQTVHRLAKEPYGLFEFVPSEGLDLALVERMILAAHDEVDNVDVVLLPESAVDESEIRGLEQLLDRHGVVGLSTGVRQRCREPGRLPGNWVHTGVSPRLVKAAARDGSAATEWFHVRQNKHHRWSLDGQQVDQYNLGGALHPRVRWWEATEVPRRSVGVMEFGEGITVIGVVCEDLAKIDEVADVLRSVGPSLVYTPLLDGPQLNTRWAARYASVLADDPGSSVLTLTSFGMTQRCRPGGRAPSPVVALWKDASRGTREIALESGAEGILLTVRGEQGVRASSDSRSPVVNSPLVYASAVYQVRSSRAGSGSSKPQSSEPLPAPELGLCELTILTSWAEAIAEALAYAPDRVNAILSEACGGTRWRATLGVQEPDPKLAEALEWVAREVREAVAASSAPCLDRVIAAINDDRPADRELDALARRVLRAMLVARRDQIQSTDEK